MEPNPFSPDGDDFQDTTFFTVTLNSSCPYDEGDLVITDDQGVELAYWHFWGQGEWVEEWNGLDAYGNPLPNGDYPWIYDGETWDGAGYYWPHHLEGLVTILCLSPTSSVTSTFTPSPSASPTDNLSVTCTPTPSWTISYTVTPTPT